MVSSRRLQPLLFPGVLVLVGVLTAIGLLVEGGREVWLPVPLFSIALGVWVMLLPGARHVDVSGPVGTLAEARLELVAGGAELQLRSADTGPDLYRAGLSFRGREPRVELDRVHGVVRIELPHPWWRSLLPEPFAERAVVMLNSRVRWDVSLRGDALGGRIDLSRAQLTGLSVAAGGGQLHVDLPEPSGPVQVRIDGARLSATVSVPGDTTAEVVDEAGLWHMELSGHPAEKGRHAVLPGSDGGSRRYDVVLGGGAGWLRVEPR